MPSVMRAIMIGCMLLAGGFMVSGCGESDKTATYDPETSVHPPDWLPAKHAAAARDNAGNCRECHGQDLIAGGIARVSCTTCHIGGPLQEHPDVYNGEPWISSHGEYSVANGLESCRNVWCHGVNLEGVLQSGPSCDTCHNFP